TGNLIYSNSFNKLMCRGLRRAFLVVPPRLTDAVGAARAGLERFPSLPLPATLCDFITSGQFSQHVSRMRDVYAARLHTLISSAKAELDGLLDVRPPHG